jgi:dolichol kinase
VLPEAVSLALLIGVVMLAVAIEWARFRFRAIRYQFLRRTRLMLRPRERRRPAGATYMAIAYLLAFVLFPLPLAVAAMLFAALGDATAALVGKRWGRHRARWGKSWEGTAAGAFVNVAVALAIPGLPVGPAVAGALAAATLEFLPLPIDDNLSVTLGGGTAGWLVWLLVAPLPAP